MIILTAAPQLIMVFLLSGRSDQGIDLRVGENGRWRLYGSILPYMQRSTGTEYNM